MKWVLTVAVMLGLGLTHGLTLTSAQSTSPPPAGVRRVTSVEGITEYRLANGLQVLLFPDPSKATITVNITYLVGSKHENYGETGMAHLLEHLLFKGSTRHPNVPKELQDHGSRPNGTTWYDRTNYFETFDASDANLEWALDLEADRMVNSFVAQKDLASEMTVVRNEFESGENNPLWVLFDRVLSTAYLWHNYGKSTIGSRSDIENVPIDRLQAFYRLHYQPDNAVLVVSGKIDEPRTIGLVAKYFGAVPRPSRTRPAVYTAEPTQDGERSVTLRRVGDVQHAIVGYHVPPGSHEDYAAFQIASQILSDTPSGRLYKALVETNKASSVSGDNLQLQEAGMAMLMAQVRRESPLEDAVSTLLETVETVRAKPFTTEEIERARNRILAGLELQLNNSEQIALQLSEWVSMGDWRLLFLNRDRLTNARAADVQRVAEHYLKSSNRTVGRFLPSEAPDRAEMPTVPDIVSTLKGYTGRGAAAVGEAFEPTPANIDARARRTALPGGVKLVLLPKEMRGNTVVATLNLRFGDAQGLMNRSAAGALTAQMLMRGTTTRTRQQIQDELDRLRARMTVTGSATGATVSVQTTREHLSAVLDLAADVLRQPAFPAPELETLRQQRLTTLETQRTDPQALVPRAFRRHVYSQYPRGDVRYVPTVEEELQEVKAVTLDDVRRFHAGFYGATQAELAIVGDFDVDATVKTVSARLDGWKSPSPYEDLTSPYRNVTPFAQVIETPDKANAVFLAGGLIAMQDDHPDYPAMMFANYLIGQGINSRLFARVRGKEGLSYGIGSALSVAANHDGALFQTTAISAPENAAKVEAAFRDEIGIILKNGFSAAEIAAGKASWVQSQQVTRSQDPSLASRLATHARFSRTMAWDAEVQKRVEALTSDAVVAALRRHLDLSTMSFLKGGEFRKTAPKP
jgi:zinc protease